MKREGGRGEARGGERKKGGRGEWRSGKKKEGVGEEKKKWEGRRKGKRGTLKCGSFFAR